MVWRYYVSDFRKSNHIAPSVPCGELDRELYLMCQKAYPMSMLVSGTKQRGLHTCTFRHKCTNIWSTAQIVADKLSEAKVQTPMRPIQCEYY